MCETGSRKMSRWCRARVLVVVLGGAAAVASGCGSAGGQIGTVVSVAGVGISKASVDHWMPIEAVLSNELVPTRPPPRGAVPDPPGYRACISWLGSDGPLESRSLSVAQRRARCIQRLANLKQKTVEFLILYQWYLGETRDQGIRVSESEVERNLKRYIRYEMPGRGHFQRYLSAAGMSEADALFVQRLSTYGEKINHEILAKPTPGLIRKAFVSFTSKWTTKTSCMPGYVFPGCRQYHGSLPPP